VERVHDARRLYSVVEPKHDEALVEPGRVDNGSWVGRRLALLGGAERCERVGVPYEGLDDSLLCRRACVQPAGFLVRGQVDRDRRRAQGLFEVLPEEEERRGELHCRLGPSQVVGGWLGERLTAQLRRPKLVSLVAVHTLEEGERLSAIGAGRHGRQCPHEECQRGCRIARTKALKSGRDRPATDVALSLERGERERLLAELCRSRARAARTRDRRGVLERPGRDLIGSLDREREVACLPLIVLDEPGE
jgi:hypothetical protein